MSEGDDLPSAAMAVLDFMVDCLSVWQETFAMIRQVNGSVVMVDGPLGQVE